MGRVAQIVRQITDVFGDHWDARESRHTPHGWPLWLGWPSGFPRGAGGVGGPRAIITEPLRDYLESTLLRDVELPIGRTTVKRLRRVLDLDWNRDVRDWWSEHSYELLTTTGREFARRHGMTEAAVSLQRRAMFGRRLRPAGWWKIGESADLLRSQLPRAYVADRLGISVGTVGRLRWELRRAR